MKQTKKFIFLALGLLVIVLAAAVLYPKLAERYGKTSTMPTETGQEEEESIKAPDFEVIDANGETVKLSDHYGKPIIVNFWATWCGYCVKELPAFEKCASEYGDEVKFMMVDLADGSSETVEGAKEFIESKGYTFPVYFDTEFSAAEAYSVTGIPLTVFIDSSGNLIQKHVGAMNEETLTGYIDQLTGGTE